MNSDDIHRDLPAMLEKAQHDEAEADARVALGQSDFLGSVSLERWTGIPASTWRYWAMMNAGPRSFKIGRRRVWKRSDVLLWLASQEAETGTGGGAA